MAERSNDILNWVGKLGWLIGLVAGASITWGVLTSDVENCKKDVNSLKTEVKTSYVRKEVFDLYRENTQRELGEIKQMLCELNSKMDKVVGLKND